MVAVHTGTSTSTLTKLTVLQEAVRVITDLENRLRGTGWPLRNAASSVGDAAPVCRPCPYVLCMNLCCRVIHVRIGTRLEVLYRYPSLAIRQRLNILNQIHTHTHAVLTAIFQGQPVFPSPFVPPLRMAHCAFCWKRPKLFMSFTLTHQVFLERLFVLILSLGNKLNVWLTLSGQGLTD